AEDPEPSGKGLLEIDAEAVLDGGLERVGGDIRRWRAADQEIVYGLAIDAHVGVIDVAQKADDALLMADGVAAKFKLGIFRTGAAQVGVQVDAIGDFGHEGFGEA